MLLCIQWRRMYKVLYERTWSLMVYAPEWYSWSLSKFHFATMKPSSVYAKSVFLRCIFCVYAYMCSCAWLCHICSGCLQRPEESIRSLCKSVCNAGLQVAAPQDECWEQNSLKVHRAFLIIQSPPPPLPTPSTHFFKIYLKK